MEDIVESGEDIAPSDIKIELIELHEHIKICSSSNFIHVHSVFIKEHQYRVFTAQKVKFPSVLALILIGKGGKLQ